MEAKSVDELKRVAEVHGARMSKQQRLCRWADLLERQANRILMSLIEVEYLPPEERDGKMSHLVGTAEAGDSGMRGADSEGKRT